MTSNCRFDQFVLITSQTLRGLWSPFNLYSSVLCGSMTEAQRNQIKQNLGWWWSIIDDLSDLRHCDFWVGGERDKDDPDWRWTATKHPITYTNWNHGEPNNGAGHEHCLQVHMSIIWHKTIYIYCKYDSAIRGFCSEMAGHVMRQS